MKPKLLTIERQRQRPLANLGEGRLAYDPVCAIAINASTALDPIPAAVEIKINRKSLLLVSDDTDLGKRLMSAARHAGLAFTQIDNPFTALLWSRQHLPAVVYLDLDLPVQAGWLAAEEFLRSETCPSLILLTSRTGHFDLDAALEAGAVVSKSASLLQLLERTAWILAEADADRVDRKARQRLLLRWLKPYDWPVPDPPVNRFWGINE
jgi:CheY-like chemotaxis protein